MKANIQKKEFVKKCILMGGEFVDFIEACIKDANDDMLHRILDKYEKEINLEFNPGYKLTIDDLKNITNVFRKRNFFFKRGKIKAILVRLLVNEIITKDLENIIYFDDDFNISTLIERGVLHGEVYYEEDVPVYIPRFEKHPKIGYKLWSKLFGKDNYTSEQLESMFSESKLISLDCSKEKRDTTLCILNLIVTASIIHMYGKYGVQEVGVTVKSFIERVLESEVFENIISHISLTECVTDIMYNIYDNCELMVDVLYTDELTFEQVTDIGFAFPKIDFILFEDYVYKIKQVFEI